MPVLLAAQFHSSQEGRHVVPTDRRAQDDVAVKRVDHTVLRSLRNECNPDAHCDMDEPWKHLDMLRARRHCVLPNTHLGVESPGRRAALINLEEPPHCHPEWLPTGHPPSVGEAPYHVLTIPIGPGLQPS